MVTIAVCDDEQKQRKHMIDILYGMTLENSFYISEYASGEELLDDIRLGYSANIYFLDVYMGVSNGIEIAREIREFDKNCAIIFATNSRDHAVHGYGVHALQYLLKPLDERSVGEALAQALEQLSSREDRCISLTNKQGVYRISYSDILYVESNARVALVHTHQKEPLCFYIRLDELEQQLDDKRFYRCHKSYMVNLDHVYSVSGSTMVMKGGNSIPVSVKVTEAKSRFASHMANHL
ncbi:LytTR family two component transcriptional regulator [Hydrogenoanaerobacterium saccharovorans]|uniref:Stage 0 sporulation protein A homolog n=1 Tax=Hydrogenoanaerobacterium saccharovorans TaxID=474960 RepID=A0A1H8AYN2_9FIRM|nr:LytTR family DNA-binding domain-containing protein [Hydrogenoanaerobacterium saccharovorans]RPF47675.1 LytTR family two component transcriptional regulator [Hydrogenoanaerobacterium saccharovorans]SEM75852.1 two component transcriptional regulator, LytTR family [Hydrogenoanaerobacterium saccharovorans]